MSQYQRRIDRRSFLRSAATLILVGPSLPVLASDLPAGFVNASKRGQWDDEFDSQGSRTATAVTSHNPTFGSEAVANMQRAIIRYEEIVSAGGWQEVRTSVKLEIGMRDATVVALRERLIASGDLSASAGKSPVFDSLVEESVKRFQARHGLPPDGRVGEFTLKAMNVAGDIRLGQLRTNLARLQASTSDLGQRYVLVNIPAAQVEAVEDGRVVYRFKAVVGRIDRPTPILDSRIFEIILNPYWTVPRSIIQKDIMPLMRKNPNYLTDNKIRLFDSSGNEIDPSTIDWHADKAPPLMFRQDPGKINAMASTKINFHNDHAVYMHDTPQQGLFNKLSRFDSSGCVRVQNIRDMETWLLRDTPGWGRMRIDQAIKSGVNTPIRLATEIPVYFRYITAWSEKDGIVQFRDDIYHLDGERALALDTGLNQEPNLPEY
jgi:murein L,D-transpeptidase YcbB/YkuD